MSDGHLTELAIVSAILDDGAWRTLHELQTIIRERYARQSAETGISARLRELRVPGTTIERRLRFGPSTWEYRLVRVPPGMLFRT